MKRAGRRGFTLIELLVVIFIISLLTGIIIPIISHAIYKTNLARTRMLLGQCEAACGNFFDTYNRYPWMKSAEVKKKMQAGKAAEVEIMTSQVLSELRGQGALNISADYLGTVKSRYIKDLGDGPTLVDPWGREISIRIDPKTLELVFWSVGRDGKDDTNDGASPDPVAEPDIYYYFEQGDSGDDIRSK